MSTVEHYRKVLLVLIAHIPPQDVLDTACPLCDHLGASLEIGRLSNRLPEDLLTMAVKEVARSGLRCVAISKPDWAVEDLTKWANSQSYVAAVMTSASNHEATTSAGQAELWQHLTCPPVLAGREHQMN